MKKILMFLVLLASLPNMLSAKDCYCENGTVNGALLFGSNCSSISDCTQTCITANYTAVKSCSDY